MENTFRGNRNFFIILLSMLAGNIILSRIDALSITGKLIGTQFGFILIPAIILAAKDGKIKDRIKIKKIGLIDIIAILSISVFSVVMAGMVNVLSTRVFHNFLQDAVTQFPSMGLAQWLFILAFTPAICEEVVMRGVVLSEYKHVSYFKAALINGLLFGILHLNINQFLYAFILGIIMAYLVFITKSILSSMLMHFSINGISAYANWKMNTSGADFTAQQAQAQELLSGNEILMICFIGLIIVLGVIVFVINIWAKIKGISLSNKEFIRDDENNKNIFDIWIVLSIVIFIGMVIMNYMAIGKI